jgi:carbonic anhydrase/acetyltransferase-like protein (isoleucine patch superfamily)
MAMSIYALGEAVPDVEATAYVAPGATVIGRVALAAGSSVWPAAVLRADNEPIRIGAGSNVQDGAVVHTDPGFATVVGNGVSIGHGAVLHGCRIGDGCLIGIGAVVLNGAVIGEQSLVGAGALVTEGKQFPPRSLLVGVPAKVARSLSDEEVAGIARNGDDYVARARTYRSQLRRSEGAPQAKAKELGNWQLP